MKLTPHSPREFADALKNILPPGNAWNHQVGSFGDRLVLATAEELARIDAVGPIVLERAIEMHRPKSASWHISEYRRVAREALGGLTETMPRRAAGIGGKVGDRLWSHAAPALTFPVDLVQVDHLLGPARIGSRIGDRLWGERSRYVMRVRYYRSVVNPSVVWEALAAFQQSHVFLWFEDITGVGGSYAPN